MSGLVLWIALALAHEGVGDRLILAEARVRAEPGVAAWRVDRADLYRRSGDPRKALGDVAAALNLDPTPEAWLVAAECYDDLGDLAAVERAASEAVPDDEAYALRALARAARGDVPGALDDWDEAIALAPTPDRVLARGRLAEAADPDLAVAGYEHGIALLGSPSLRLALYDLERRRGRTDAARAQADALLAAVPDHPEWLLLRADVEDASAARADRERALAVLDAQIAIRPTEQRTALRARAVAALEAP